MKKTSSREFKFLTGNNRDHLSSVEYPLGEGSTSTPYPIKQRCQNDLCASVVKV